MGGSERGRGRRRKRTVVERKGKEGEKKGGARRRKEEKLNSLGHAFVPVQYLCLVHEQRQKCPLVGPLMVTEKT